MLTKQLEESRRPIVDRPMTTTRLTFPDGTVRYVLVPKGYDIQLRWVRYKQEVGAANAAPDAFMTVLHEETVVDADVQVDVDLPLS